MKISISSPTIKYLLLLLILLYLHPIIIHSFCHSQSVTNPTNHDIYLKILIENIKRSKSILRNENPISTINQNIVQCFPPVIVSQFTLLKTEEKLKSRQLKRIGGT